MYSGCNGRSTKEAGFGDNAMERVFAYSCLESTTGAAHTTRGHAHFFDLLAC